MSTITISPITITPMEFKDIINNVPTENSSGYFIETMKSLNTYIKGEFDKGRITGNDYAQVYIAAMQYALQNSFQYEIEQHRLQFEYAKSQEELELLRAQAEKVRVETAIEQEKLQLLKDTHQAAIDKAYTEVKLLQSKVVTETKQQIVLDEQALKLKADVLLTNAKVTTEGKQQLVLTEQVNKLKADTLLTNAKEITEGKQQLVLIEQAAKLKADTLLVKAKTTTETNTQAVLTSQKALYEKQTKGIEAKHNINHLTQIANLAAVFYGKGGTPDAMAAGLTKATQAAPLNTALTKSAAFPS